MFANVTRQNLVKIADAYARARGISRSHVSKTFYGRGNFLDEFKRGRQSISIDKMDSILKAFREQWPDGAEWPFLPVVNMGRGS